MKKNVVNGRRIDMGNLSKDFDSSEFMCPCGCKTFVKNDDLVYKLQKIRDRLGKPITVTSGTRCTIHDREVGGVGESHINGCAADIYCEDRYELLKYAMQLFNRVGIAKQWIHVDVDTRLPQKVYWIYDSNRKRIHFEPA